MPPWEAGAYIKPLKTQRMYTGPSKKVIVIIFPKLIVFQGLKYNTIGNAINDDNPYRNAAKS